MAKKNISKMAWEESYIKKNIIGQGGNATVYSVASKEDNVKYALKSLNSHKNKEKKCRFKEEIEVMNNNFKNIEGIIPIIDYSLEDYWYVMPIAEPALDFIKKNNFSIKQNVNAIIQLSQTLEKLHKKNISHRDIKPDNLYYFNDRFCFGDFGLVDYPDKDNDFTKSTRGLGAIFTIAPEMKRNPNTADGKKGDVFSLAKTMWMFLTYNKKGFDGVYDYNDPVHSLRECKQIGNEHIVEIDELLKDSTDNNPDKRPSISEFISRLKEWKHIYDDSYKSQESDWYFLNKQLFGEFNPESVSWIKKEDIIKVLNIIGNTPAYNHMFMPDGGGLDLEKAELAEEKDCICVYANKFCLIVNPKKLSFEGFNKKHRWNYFLLELNEMKPVLGMENVSYNSQSLVEDIPGHYVSDVDSCYGVYDYNTGVPLPKGYRKVNRDTKGKFLIMMKSGPYNNISETYDGRHGDCSASEFRKYIDDTITKYYRFYDYFMKQGKLDNLSVYECEERILSKDEFSKNPFKKDDSQTIANDINKEQIYKQRKKRDSYIKNNFYKWDFTELIQSYESTSNSKVKFAFIYKHNDNYKNNNKYLYKNGYINNQNQMFNENCFVIYNLDEAIAFKDKLNHKVSEYLSENNFIEQDSNDNFFQIELHRNGKPTHMFTKEEIKEEMLKADDRYYNIIVINEDGYVNISKGHFNEKLFPVKSKLCDARDCKVGKYFDSSLLDKVYPLMLKYWLEYLKTGRAQDINIT